MKNIQELVDNGSILECPGCGGLSAHAWEDVDEANGIAHIGAASCCEWQCGHCKTYWMEKGCPLDHPCYTHREYDEGEKE